MNRIAVIRRLTTGVPGLDEILSGGLPELSFNLVVGPPGSGKTTLAHQIMFALATREQPALFFTVLGEPHLIEAHSLHVTLSIGISLYPDHGKDKETVIRNADIAMYFVKQKGRNNYRVFTPDMKGVR
jgi:GGDEF domain-containing protein